MARPADAPVASDVADALPGRDAVPPVGIAMTPAQLQPVKKSFIEKIGEGIGVGTLKKPSRPSTVKAKEKDLIEKSVRDNDSVKFGELAKELYQKDPEYFVKLLSYKLDKHWKDGKRDMWLNEAPPEAMEALFRSRDKNVDDGLVTSKQWTAVLNIESATRGPDVGGKDSGARLRQALANLDPDDLTTCFKAFKTRNDPEGVKFEPFTELFQHLEMKDLIRCGKTFFDKEDQRPPIDWTGLDDLGKTNDLAELSRQAERVNELYEQAYSGLKDDAQMLGNLWGSELAKRLYAKRDELLRDEYMAKEVFGVENQFERQLEQAGISGLGEEAEKQIALVKSRLRAFGEETIVFDGSKFKNDCGIFARKFMEEINVRAPRGAVSLHFDSHASRLTFVLPCPADTTPSKSRGEIPPQGAGNLPIVIEARPRCGDKDGEYGHH